MTQTYRTNDAARWGTGQGFNLSPAQVDINFWDLVQRMLVQEDRVIPPGIAYFSISGRMMYVHLDDGFSVLGPYELPIAIFRSRGEWAPATVYEVLDTFSINGGLYVVVLAHTSAATFDPGANDGAGHNYYSLMIQTPGSTIPAGGTATQVLMKSTDADYAVTWGYHLPIGGTVGQSIVKLSSAGDDAEWDFLDAANVEFVPATGSVLTADNVADALEQASGSGGGETADDVEYTPPTGSTITASNVQDAIDQLEVALGGGGYQTIWVPASSMIPQTTNGPASNIVELSGKTMLATLDYDSATQEWSQFIIALPKSFDYAESVIRYKVFWSHATGATTFGVTFGMQVKAVSDLEGLDGVWGASGTVDDTGGTANILYVTDRIQMSISGTPVDGDMLYFRLFRNPASSTDTLNVDCRVHGVQLFYNTIAATDD